MTGRNLLIIGNYPPPYGGVPNHIERLSQYLVQRGWNCHVLSGGTTGNQQIGMLSIYKPTYMRKFLGISRRLLDHQFKRWLDGGTLNREDARLWARYKMYADVGAEIVRNQGIGLIASYNLLTYAPVGAWLSVKFGLPHVISVFGELYKYDSMMRNRAFFGHVVDTAARVLSCSDHCGRSVERLQVNSQANTVVYGVDVAHFTPGGDLSELRESLGLGISPVVLFVGRLGKEMGLDSFLAAAKLVSQRFPDVRFLMVGQEEELAEEVEEKCRETAGKFILVRNVAYTDLPKYYRVASMVVVPTRGARTCSSLTAMEAMAAGKVVIAYAIGGIPELIEHDKTGLLVTPEDTNALANTIAGVLEDEALRKRLADAGYEQAQKRFDERLTGATMERHFIEVLNGA